MGRGSERERESERESERERARVRERARERARQRERLNRHGIRERGIKRAHILCRKRKRGRRVSRREWRESVSLGGAEVDTDQSGHPIRQRNPQHTHRSINVPI